MPEPDPAPGTLLCVGEALIDIVRTADAETEHVGGSPANVAVGLARLGHRTDLATHLGADERGARITAYLAERGVRLREGGAPAPRTPTAAATVDGEGVATYEFDLSWELAPVDLDGVVHVHTGSIAATLEPGGGQVVALMEAARSRATVSYDPNARPSIMGAPEDARQRIEECIGRSDVVKASTEDVEWLYAGAPPELVAREWGRLGPGLVVITRGGDGALAHLSGSDLTLEVPGRPVDVVDTVGAGDSFMAGLLSGLLDAGLLGSGQARAALARTGPEAVRRCVERAVATASWTVARAGAAAPSRAELD